MGRPNSRTTLIQPGTYALSYQSFPIRVDFFRRFVIVNYLCRVNSHGVQSAIRHIAVVSTYIRYRQSSRHRQQSIRLLVSIQHSSQPKTFFVSRWMSCNRRRTTSSVRLPLSGHKRGFYALGGKGRGVRDREGRRACYTIFCPWYSCNKQLTYQYTETNLEVRKLLKICICHANFHVTLRSGICH